MSTLTSTSQLTLTVNGTETTLSFEALQSQIQQDLMGGIDGFFLLWASTLVFFMQAGFTFLEVGSVHSKNTRNILAKNLGDVSIGAIGFFLVGYGLAFGDGNGFIGTFSPGILSLSGDEGQDHLLFLFQFAFAATSATIVSGAMAERISFHGYLVFSFCMTLFIYPTVAHWAWSSTGFASKAKGIDSLFEVGVIDFAGSGVVHMTGGVGALVGCYIIGSRTGRFDKRGRPRVKIQQSPTMQTLGALVLWFGWYGFNCGSMLSISKNMVFTAGTVAVNTTLAAASGGITSSILGMFFRRRSFDPFLGSNGIIAGLVSITSGCATVEPYAAVISGIVGACIYFSFSNILLRFQIDDVVDAIPNHLFGGYWGLIVPGIFSTQERVAAAFGQTKNEASCGIIDGCDKGMKQLLANVVFGLIIIAWVGILSGIIFTSLKSFGILRVDKLKEEVGLDGPLRREGKLLSPSGMSSPSSSRAASTVQFTDEQKHSTKSSHSHVGSILSPSGNSSPSNSVRFATDGGLNIPQSQDLEAGPRLPHNTNFGEDAVQTPGTSTATSSKYFEVSNNLTNH